MNEKYAFGVAMCRAKENSLLSRQDIDEIAAAPSYKRAIELLSNKGYDTRGGYDYEEFLKLRMNDAIETVKSAAENSELLNILFVKNDFHNLKTALKGKKSETEYDKFFEPFGICTYEVLKKSVEENDFSYLPELMRETAEKANELLQKTGSGQLCDIVCDRGAMSAMLCLAEKSKDEVLISYAKNVVLCADVKILLRCAKTEKPKSFMEEALCKIPGIDFSKLEDSALKGESEFIDALSELGFSKFKEKIDEGFFSFEKYCDDILMENFKMSKYTAFGLSPIAAYYYAVSAEVMCLRIILSGKLNGAEEKVVRSRIRELYV
ncbi:MAG: V-type ATPase subunit [Candidatus Fimenecus sp.]